MNNLVTDFIKNIKLTRNITLKIVSVIFAIILWLIIMEYENPEMVKTFNNVPISYDNQTSLGDKKLYPEDALDQVLDVTLRGRRKDIISLEYDAIHAAIDLKSAHSGIADFPVNVNVDNSSVVVQGYSKSAISIEFDNIEERKFPLFGFAEGELAEPNQLIRVDLSPDTVTINAPSKLLSKIDKVIVPYVLDQVNSSYTVYDKPVAIDAEGTVLDSVEISGDKIKIEVVTGKIVTAKVAIQAKPIEGDNLELVDLILSETNVELLAPFSVVDSLDTIKTELITIPSSVGKHTIDVTLSLPKDVSLIKPVKLIATATCEAIEERDITLSEANLAILDVRNLQKIKLEEIFGKIVRVRGVSSAFESVDQIIVEIDTAELEPGKHTVEYRVILPEKLIAVDDNSLTGNIALTIVE